MLVSISGAKTVFADTEKMSGKTEENVAITCYYASDYNPGPPTNIFTLSESPQRIEFTDEIGENHGGGTCINGYLIENGKVILIEVETSNSFNNDSSNTTNTTIRHYYIDSNLLPRKISVEGMLIKGFVVVEKASNKRGCSGYHFFIQDRLTELRNEKKPYTGSNASQDFIKEWDALSRSEKEKYNRQASSK
jgi:hypothetical protein